MDDTKLFPLENVLDFSDRLFDESQVIEVYALIFAHLLKSENERREAALIETDKLRHYTAELLSFFVNNLVK